MDPIILGTILTILFEGVVFFVVWVKTWGSTKQMIEQQSIEQTKLEKRIEDIENDEVEYAKQIASSISELREEMSTSFTRLNTALVGLDGSNGISGRLMDLIKTVNSLEKQVAVIETTAENNQAFIENLKKSR